MAPKNRSHRKDFAESAISHGAEGYTDTKAFREIFKKITGLTPIDYRNRFAKTEYEV